MTLYLDTSVTVSLFLKEPRADRVAAVIAGEQVAVLSSDLLIGEFGAAIAAAIRAERVSAANADRIYQLSDTWIGNATSSCEQTGTPSAWQASGSGAVTLLCCSLTRFT